MHSLSSKMKHVNALQIGNGIQHLLNLGSNILGNPLYIHDTDYKLIAHTEHVVTDDPLWNELITTGVHGKESVEFFKNEGFIDDVANAGTSVFLKSDKLQYDRILGKIQNKENITVACMDVVACNKPFDRSDSQVFEALCNIISKEISRIDFYQIYGELYQEKIICDLIHGNIRDKRLYTRRVESIYEGLGNNIHVAVVDISKFNFRHEYSIYYKNLLKAAERTFKYAIYDNYIIFIFSSDDTPPSIIRCLRKLIRVFERNNLYIGISSGFENLFIAHKYFTEAVDALYSGIRQNANQRIHLYNERM